MDLGIINANLNCFANIQLALNQVAGLAVMIEVKMRTIAQLSQEVRDKSAYLIKNSKRKEKDADYWNCKLTYLDDAIDSVFSNELNQNEHDLLKEFRHLRNKLLHGDFINLMKLMGILPTGRQLLQSTQAGLDRNLVDESDFIESVKSIDSQRNRGFYKFRQKATKVEEILNRLIRGLAK